MNALTLELHTLAAEIQATGIPATADPSRVLSLLATSDVVAVVDPTTSYTPITFGLDFDLVVPVWLITAGPYDLAAVERLDGALMAVWLVARPTETATRATYEAADAAMPALLIPTRRHVDCSP